VQWFNKVIFNTSSFLPVRTSSHVNNVERTNLISSRPSLNVHFSICDNSASLSAAVCTCRHNCSICGCNMRYITSSTNCTAHTISFCIEKLLSLDTHYDLPRACWSGTQGLKGSMCKCKHGRSIQPWLIWNTESQPLPQWNRHHNRAAVTAVQSFSQGNSNLSTFSTTVLITYLYYKIHSKPSHLKYVTALPWESYKDKFAINIAEIVKKFIHFYMHAFWCI